MAYHLLMQFLPLPKLQWQFSKQYFFNQRTRNSFHPLLISSNTDAGRWDCQEIKKFSLSINHGIYITNNLKLYKIIISTENLELWYRSWIFFNPLALKISEYCKRYLLDFCRVPKFWYPYVKQNISSQSIFSWRRFTTLQYKPK